MQNEKVKIHNFTKDAHPWVRSPNLASFLLWKDNSIKVDIYQLSRIFTESERDVLIKGWYGS